MGRQIITLKDLKVSEPTGETARERENQPPILTKDGYFDRLFKYIPAELVAGYIFVSGAVSGLTDQSESLLLKWILFAIFCILTPLYLWRVQKVTRMQQHMISLLSFAVWCFALGGPFASFGWYDPVYGQVLLLVFTLIVAVWEAEY
ncbi:MAG: hypothetical protein GYA41_12755 [Bacteroidales bacterium]|nr:hypothetical protein [Bacteroidales bacterium]